MLFEDAVCRIYLHLIRRKEAHPGPVVLVLWDPAAETQWVFLRCCSQTQSLKTKERKKASVSVSSHLLKVKHHSTGPKCKRWLSAFPSTRHSSVENKPALKHFSCAGIHFFHHQPHGQINQRNADNALPFSLTSDLLLCRVETLQRREGDCQVGPRFPVLVLFTNRNVFHPPPSLHLHLFTHPALLRYPLAPLPLECILIYEPAAARQ